MASEFDQENKAAAELEPVKPNSTEASISAADLFAAKPVSAVKDSPSEMIDGQVTKIDESAGKITIKHGPIKKWDMDPMTMVFRVQDPAILKIFKPGDTLKFDVERINGQMTITKIEKKK